MLLWASVFASIVSCVPSAVKKTTLSEPVDASKSPRVYAIVPIDWFRAMPNLARGMTKLPASRVSDNKRPFELNEQMFFFRERAINLCARPLSQPRRAATRDRSRLTRHGAICRIGAKAFAWVPRLLIHRANRRSRVAAHRLALGFCRYTLRAGPRSRGARPFLNARSLVTRLQAFMPPVNDAYPRLPYQGYCPFLA